jgi:hypothetical protein
MTVQQLIKFLKDFPPDTEIRIYNSDNGEEHDSFNVYDEYEDEENEDTLLYIRLTI